MSSSVHVVLFLTTLLFASVLPLSEQRKSSPKQPPFHAIAHATRILHVGPGRTYTAPSQAARVAQDGDVIEIDAGSYVNDWATWTASDLTIRSIGGMAHMQSSGLISNGKAIWVISGQNTTVENIEFSGARVRDRNGAGIRQEGAGLTLRHCSFHDNENGILAGSNSSSDIVIEYSEFANNGLGDSGFTHNIYINTVRSFTLRYSSSHHATIGHTLKSRANENHIVYNRIMDETSGTSSYTIDLPNGGTSYVIGNLLQQGPNTDNPVIVTYGEEGTANPDQHLYVVNNTIVNDRPNGGTFLRVVGTVPALVQNNIFVGSGTPYVGPGAINQDSNLVTTDAGFVNRASFDYQLVVGSPAINAGANPGSANGVSLTPVYEYVHPHDKQDRLTVGALDVGAYEYTPPATEPPIAPIDLSATAKSFARNDLTWTDTATNETGFKIERRTENTGTYTQIAIVSADTVTFSDMLGLRPNTPYFYRVRATNARGDSAFSNEASTTTLMGNQHFIPLVMRQ